LRRSQPSPPCPNPVFSSDAAPNEKTSDFNEYTFGFDAPAAVRRYAAAGAPAAPADPVNTTATEDSMWKRQEWQKSKYQPTPETHKGKLIFLNATKFDEQWTPNGQDVTLKIGSTQVKIAPGQRYAFQPTNDNTLKLKAKPQLSIMKGAEHTIPHPLSQEDSHYEIRASSKRGGFGLAFRKVFAY
jgi:hypothetical protein